MKQHFPLKDIQQEKRIYRGRIFFAVGLVIICLLVLASRYAYLQIFHYDEFSTASDKNRIRLQPLPLLVVTFMTVMGFYLLIITRFLQQH